MCLFAAVIFYPVISPTKSHEMIRWAFRIAAIPPIFVVLDEKLYTGDPYSGNVFCRDLVLFGTYLIYISMLRVLLPVRLPYQRKQPLSWHGTHN